MGDYFTGVIDDYENAEITCVILHDRATDTWRNLLTIIELVPAEQDPSHLIGLPNAGYCERESVDNAVTIYIARRINCPVSEAVATFKEPKNGILLQHGTKLNCLVQLFDDANLEAEPASEYPLLINGNTENTIGTILPRRHTAFRVWTKIDRQKNWLDKLTDKQKEKLFAKTGLLTRRHLGFDLSALPEHAGNIYLCGCNPYLRRFDNSLLDLKRDLLISFCERAGRTIIGKRLVLEDKREGNLSFTLQQTITGIHQRIQLPHFPDQLYTKIYDERGNLIENHTGRWINFSIGMKMIEANQE